MLADTLGDLEFKIFYRRTFLIAESISYAVPWKLELKMHGGEGGEGGWYVTGPERRREVTAHSLYHRHLNLQVVGSNPAGCCAFDYSFLTDFSSENFNAYLTRS